MEQDIILWKRLSHQLQGRLAAFTPSLRVIVIVRIRFSPDTLVSLFFSHAHVHITLSFLTGPFCFSV